MRYDPEVTAAITRWAPTYGVAIDPALVHAIIEKESSHGAQLETDEGGGRHSYGPMMVLDSTARGYGIQNPATLKDPTLGIWYGVRYLAEQLKTFRGDTARAISAYNAGPFQSRPNAAGRFPNQAYVNAVLGFWRRFKSTAVGLAPVAGLAVAALLLLWLAARHRRVA